MNVTPALAPASRPLTPQINSGNSGGPAFNDDGQCVGIAFQSLKVRRLANKQTNNV